MTAKKTALGLPDNTNPAEFDLDGWLTGATVPQRKVTVYADREAADQVADLQQRIEAVRERIESEDESAAGERTLGDKGPESELDDLVKEFDELRPRLDKSAGTFTLEPLGWSREKVVLAAVDKMAADAIRRDEPMDEGELADARVLRKIHAAIVVPKMDLAAFERVREAIGEVQMWRFVQAFNELQNADAGVDTDFSLPPSAHHLTTE